MRYALLIITLLVAMVPGPATAQVDEHRAIDFLVGEWHTTSEWPDGRTAEGVLSYRWVLGGGWMKVEFVGDHPETPVWEAHAMQRWNPETSGYEAISFAQQGPPIHFEGSVPEPGLFRIERSSDGATTGIDYRETEDGMVYQENWVEEDGERRITLRSWYRHPEPGPT